MRRYCLSFLVSFATVRMRGMRTTMEQQILKSLIHLSTQSDVRVRYGEGDETDKFLTSIQPGRQLWYFRTPPETWLGVPQTGLEGFAVIEEDHVVDCLLLSIS